jgi:hypothetical protein
MPRLTIERIKHFTTSASGFAQININLNYLRNSSTLRHAIKEAGDGRTSRWIMEQAGDGMTRCKVLAKGTCQRIDMNTQNSPKLKYYISLDRHTLLPTY